MTVDEQVNAPLPGGEHDSGESAIGDQYDRTWLGSIARPALLILMVSMIDVALLAFLRQYAPDMTPAMGWTILGLGVLAAVIGVTTTTWLACLRNACAAQAAIAPPRLRCCWPSRVLRSGQCRAASPTRWRC